MKRQRKQCKGTPPRLEFRPAASVAWAPKVPGLVWAWRVTAGGATLIGGTTRKRREARAMAERDQSRVHSYQSEGTTIGVLNDFTI